MSHGSTITGSALASVVLPDGSAELRSFPLTACAADTGWLRVEASGICGTDVALAAKRLAAPTILGHHAVGLVSEVGVDAGESWGVSVGDRVAVEEYLPCGRCEWCAAGRYRLCPESDLWRGGRRVGLVPVDQVPSLWGGNAEYMYLPPNAVVHLLPPELPAGLAVWTLPLANAIDWVSRVGSVSAGETVVILGPGYHGLAAAAVAQEKGAGRVLVGGTPTDGARLRMAERLGAETFDALSSTVVDDVKDRAGGRLADLVVDTVGGGPETFATAVSLLGPTGRLVVAGIKNPAAALVDAAALVRGMHTISGVRGRDPVSVRASIELLMHGGAGLADVPTHEVSLADVGSMLARLAAGKGPTTPHVVVRPTNHTDGNQS